MYDDFEGGKGQRNNARTHARGMASRPRAAPRRLGAMKRTDEPVLDIEGAGEGEQGMCRTSYSST